MTTMTMMEKVIEVMLKVYEGGMRNMHMREHRCTHIYLCNTELMCI